MRLFVLSGLLAVSTSLCLTSASADEPVCAAAVPSLLALRSDGVVGVAFTSSAGWGDLAEADPNDACYVDPTPNAIDLCEKFLSAHGQTFNKEEFTSLVALLKSKVEVESQEVLSQGAKIRRLARENKRLKARTRSCR